MTMTQYNTSEKIDVRLKELGYSELDIKNKRCAVCAPGNTISKSQFEREVACLVRDVDRMIAKTMEAVNSLFEVRVVDDSKYDEIQEEARKLEARRMFLPLIQLAGEVKAIKTQAPFRMTTLNANNSVFSVTYTPKDEKGVKVQPVVVTFKIGQKIINSWDENSQGDRWNTNVSVCIVLGLLSPRRVVIFCNIRGVCVVKIESLTQLPPMHKLSNWFQSQNALTIVKEQMQQLDCMWAYLTYSGGLERLPKMRGIWDSDLDDEIITKVADLLQLPKEDVDEVLDEVVIDERPVSFFLTKQEYFS